MLPGRFPRWRPWQGRVLLTVASPSPGTRHKGEAMSQKANGEAATQGAAAGGKVNKLEEVRQSLARLGNDATNQQIQADLKERVGLEMTTKHISASRSDITKKAQGGKPTR